MTASKPIMLFHYLQREKTGSQKGNIPNLTKDHKTMADKQSRLIADFALLRLLVGYLGEKPQFGLWDTNFLSKTSIQFLEITFPRSYLSAGCVSVSQAARRVHDQLIGKNGSASSPCF